MPGARLVIAKEGEDALTSDAVDKAFDSEFYLPKVTKVVRVTSDSSVAHSLSYPPMIVFFREIEDSPKKIGYVTSQSLSQTNSTIDDEDINFKIMSHFSDFTTTPYTSTNDSAAIAFMFLDPLGTPSAKPVALKSDQPVVRVGGTDGCADYERKVHSYYDSLKVYTTGTLTLNVPSWTPSAVDEYDEVSTSYSHNLGYIPFFTPLAPVQLSLQLYYSWYWQWHNRPPWAIDTEYLVDDYASNGGNEYICTVYHTSTASDEPGVGANWTDFWTLSAGGAPMYVPTTIDINNFEDIKYVYGGSSFLDDEELEVYATSTDLVINLKRIADGTFGYNTFPARTITMDYTIFYNRLDEDMDILDEYST